ncbi:choline transporter-like protein 5-A isoform 4-T24 [Amazona ochrocephala]
MKTFSQTGSSADPAGCVEPTVIQAVLDVPVCLLFLQLCVSKCPGRFVTYTDVQASYRYKCDQWNYFKQFCKPGFNSPLQAPAVKSGEEATEYSLGHFSLLLKPYVMKFILR